MLFSLHVVAAVLAVWRITELFTADRVTAKLREKFPTYLWQCPRCMSVWAGAWTTLVLVMSFRWPWIAFLNWPFALAWLYLVQLEWALQRRLAQKGREMRVSIQPNGQYQIFSDLSQPETAQLVASLYMQMNPVRGANGVARPENVA